MPGRVESPSAQLGQLLLRGWTMLAEACEDCQLPLMRDPSTMLGHCVGCRKMYNTEGQEVQADRVPVPAAEPAGPEPAPANGPTMNGPVAARSTTAAATTTSSSAPSAATQAAPAANGGAAAAEQQQQQHPGYSASTEGEEAGADEIRQRYLQMRQQREQLERQQQQRSITGAAAGQDPCQLLADRLLQGWAMLAEHCPLCNTPLMRSRAGDVRCIACDLPVRMETSSTAAPTVPAAAAPAGEAAAPAAAAAGTVATSQVPRQQQEQHHDLVAPPSSSNGHVGQPVAAAAAPTAAAVQSSANRLLAGGSSGTSIAAASVGGAVNTSSLLVQQHQVLSSLQQVLLLKLDDARQVLLATPAEQADNLGGQLALTQQLMSTLAAVKAGMPK